MSDKTILIYLAYIVLYKWTENWQSQAPKE